MKITEMDSSVSIRTQMQTTGAGGVVLINTFRASPAQADALIAAWAEDARYFKRQPGFISAQLHRGIAGSGVFVNYAVWESTAHFRRAFENPEFAARLAAYPADTEISPHLFQKLAVADVCVA
jgi:heme-degrading monooxygenase HmoA